MSATTNLSHSSEPVGGTKPVPERELCPLSFAQERLWFLDQLDPGSPAYNISQAWRMEGDFNLPAFQQALNEVIRRHETLRTTFSRVEGKPVVIISAFKPYWLQPVDLAADTNPDAAASRLIDQAAGQPFNLQQGPLLRVDLFRLAAREHIALFTLHHIISDAWSFEILRREITELYAAANEGKPTSLPDLPIQYLDYAHWQREQLSGENLEKEISFWRQQLAGEIPRLELPCDRTGAGNPSRGGSEPFELSRELTAALRALAQGESATLFTVLLAAFTTLLHRLTGQKDMVVGSPILGRDQVETEGLIGMFVNTIALRIRLDGNPTFLGLLAGVREITFNALTHSEVPFEEVVKALQPERASGQNPLFQVVMALHGGYPQHWALGNLPVAIVDVATPSAKFDWTFMLEEADGGMKARLEYRTDQFEANSIRSFLRQFQLLLAGIVANPRRRISELPLMDDAERRQVLVDWNQTTTDYERNACIHELFESQAQKMPQATALVFGQQRITYGELNQRANQLAHRLRKHGVPPDTLIGLCLDRSPEMIVAMLAILKAGGAYVPLDRNYPKERLEFMLNDAGVRMLITTGRTVGRAFQPAGSRDFRVPCFSTSASTTGDWKVAGTGRLESLTCKQAFPILYLDQESELESESRDNPHIATTAENLAYVLYTSGSTGTPKGAAIRHRGVVRLVRNPNYVTFSPDDIFLQLAPISFDASTFEIWGALLNGATLVIHPPEVPSLEELGRNIQAHGITTLWLTAGLFHQMVDHQLANLKSVRQLLAGGDVLSVPHVLKAVRELPGCQLINGYGPTENTTFTCCYRVPSNWAGGRSVPIGRPISNTRVFVLDENLAPVPVGVPGELFIGGDGLAREYLNRPELNREKFLTISFDPSRPNETLYRTGDRVRWLSDGNLEFLGRKDQQVKIRGFRVELGEIEAALKQHPAIREAAVIVRESQTKDRQLAAYVTLQNAADFDAPSLREFLSAKLPGYMVPAHFVSMTALPLTPNGKLDPRALPAPEIETNQADAAVTAPRNVTEETLCQIWSEVLGRNSFGIHDNFFQLGGHSLLITQMISRIARALQVELPVRSVFEAPTIAALAEKIQQSAPIGGAGNTITRRKTGPAQARQLLTRIDDLSEAEVESLLSRQK